MKWCQARSEDHQWEELKRAACKILLRSRAEWTTRSAFNREKRGALNRKGVLQLRHPVPGDMASVRDRKPTPNASPAPLSRKD